MNGNGQEYTMSLQPAHWIIVILTALIGTAQGIAVSFPQYAAWCHILTIAVVNVLGAMGISTSSAFSNVNAAAVEKLRALLQPSAPKSDSGGEPPGKAP